MGGFQAVAAGIGGAGEEAGQGYNQALNEALKVRQQNFIESNAANEIALRYAQLKQQGSLEGQRNDLLHQQIVGQGWKDQGLSYDSGTKQYTRTYYNDQTNETRKLPQSGIPPDSPQAHLETYKMLKEQGFDDTKAQEIAFKMGNLYRTDPVGIAQEWQDRAKQLFEDDGVRSVPIIGYGNVDITTPAGQAKYAQIMADSNTRGISAMYRAMYGNGSQVNGGKNLDGFTADEAREFKAYEETLKGQGGLRERLAIANINNELDPRERDKITKQTMGASEKDEKALNDKYNEIFNRRAWSMSAFMAKNPNATATQIAAARHQAQANHMRIVQ